MSLLLLLVLGQSGQFNISDKTGLGVDVSTVAGKGALKVDVVQTVSSGGGGGTVTQGTPGSSTTPWYVQLADGSHTVLVTVNNALKVDGSAVTQPVSGTFWQATQPVSLASAPTTPVTGTFWQATQPVSGTFWQATQPVSGTFFQATQPVSIASMPSTPVTGTFWQGTQPVSIASMPSTPVTGTFWQGTQPVSVASMPSTPVTGTFWQSSQPVTIATNLAGTQQALAADTTGQLFVRTSAPPPLNPFLQRCNPVRRSNCQP